jgi:hypothetical protein
MFKLPERTGTRRTAAIAAGLIGLGVVVSAAFSGAASALSAPVAAAVPVPVSDDGIRTTLGVGQVPTELIFLVDLSGSMSIRHNGPYPQVQQKLPAYLSQLPASDQVVVIGFGNLGRAKEPIYGPGAPTANINLPPDANESTTDFGDAFSAALDQLTPPQPTARAAAVLLLSDGELYAPNDPQYSSWTAPGWPNLQKIAAHLSIPLTAFAVPLTTNGAYIQAQQYALTKVFGPANPVETLPGSGDLTTALNEAVRHVVDGEVASAVSADSNLGVQATWSDLPGGSRPLKLGSADTAHVTLTLRALTSKVPLYVTDLRVTAKGMTVTASGLPAVVTLDPGQPQAIPVTLSWKGQSGGLSFGGGDSSTPGTLHLAATVGSSWAEHLPDFHVTNFSAGIVHGATSGELTGVEPTTGIWMYLVGLLVLALLGALVWAYLIRLSGTLSVALVDYPDEPALYRLPPFPIARTGTDRLARAPGRMTVRRALTGRGMRVTVDLPKSRGTVTLRPGGRAMAAGLVIKHDDEKR